MAWTDERVQQVRKLWFDEAKSASQIARILGDVTRNAVIGVIHRQGWSGKRGSTNPPNLLPAPRKATTPRPKPKPVVPLPEPEAAHTAGGDLITGLTIETAMCRWPIGSPGQAGFHYCGQATERRRDSYCEAHEAMAYQPNSTTRRRPERSSNYDPRGKAQKRFGSA